MILHRLKQTQTKLSKSEHRIAEVVLTNPHAIVLATTAELATLAEVSDPMVSRFCRSLGCKGFPEFKVLLAQSLAHKPSYLTQAVSGVDDEPTIINKIISANQRALAYLQNNLKAAKVKTAISFLNKAKRIEIFGMGGSASIAQDAQHKLFRLGTPVMAYEDMIKQRMTAAAANKNTLIIFISFTGRTTAMVETAEVAKQTGAKLLALTVEDSPLGEICDLVLTSGSELEDTTIYVPMTSRILILTIIDILATGLALERSPKIDKHLIKIKESLDNTKSNL